jgi:hypothetical protein
MYKTEAPKIIEPLAAPLKASNLIQTATERIFDPQ